MQTQAYFDDIQLHILHEIRKATTSIHIAVAWFTDPEIFEQLCQKATPGVRVELMVVNIEVLNIAGPREAKCPGLHTTAFEFLRQVFR